MPGLRISAMSRVPLRSVSNTSIHGWRLQLGFRRLIWQHLKEDLSCILHECCVGGEEPIEEPAESDEIQAYGPGVGEGLLEKRRGGGQPPSSEPPGRVSNRPQMAKGKCGAGFSEDVRCGCPGLEAVKNSWRMAFP
jgi:hypothetical protein